MMRQTNSRLIAEQKPLGVIDTLTAGFETVRKRPWTLAVPVLFDLLIWVLPKISLAELFRPTIDAWLNAAAASPDTAANAEETRQAFSQLMSSLNLFGLLTTALNSVARVPSLLAVDAVGVPSPFTSLAYTISLDSGLLALLLFVPLFLLGLFAAALYIELVAQGVRPLEAPASRLDLLPRVGRLWLRLMGLAAVLFAVVFLAGLLLLLSQAFEGIGADAALFVAALLSVGLIWWFIYLFFVVSALAVSRVGLLEAIRRSVLLFRVQFWSSIGLVLLILLLDRGLSLIWRGLTVSSWGVPVAIVLNAFIGTSLLAASMIFYQDRMNWIERMRTSARPVRR